jgi:hypothetical protein
MSNENQTVTIPLYRIMDRGAMSLYGQWHVQKWNGDAYENITSFRSESEAQEFIAGR